MGKERRGKEKLGRGIGLQRRKGVWGEREIAFRTHQASCNKLERGEVRDGKGKGKGN